MAKCPSPRKTQLRAAPRCHRCSSRPLRSQCIHTAIGRAYLANLPDANQSVSTPEAVQSQHELPQASMTSELELLGPTSHTEASDTPLPVASGDEPSMSTLGNSAESSVDPESSIDPSLLTLYPIDGHIPSTLGILQPNTNFSNHSLAQTPPSTPSRVRPTAGNALYGIVEGAKQGNTSLDIVRTKPLRNPAMNSRAAGARFHRVLSEIISRCERISMETNCWLFIGAQHMNATTGLLTYASPRLRRDARSELSDLQNRFNTIISALHRSRRREAVELALELDVVYKKKIQAEQEVIRARSEACLREDKIRAQDKLIAELQALVNGTAQE